MIVPIYQKMRGSRFVLARLPLARHSKSVNSLKRLKTAMGSYSK
jgi:hypothetical protein